MVDNINNTCKILAHICLYIVRSGQKLRDTVIQVSSDNLVDPALLIVSVKFIHALSKQTVSGADKYTVCVALFDLFGNIKHTFTGGDHIVNNDNVLALYGVTKKLMCYNRVLAVYNGGIITSLIEHTHVYAKDIGEVHRS